METPLQELCGTGLVVKAKSEVQANTFPEFKIKARAILDGINMDLETDQDFAEAKQNIKDCKSLETRLSQIKQDLLTGSKELASVVTDIDTSLDEFTKKRLTLNKTVTSEETRRKCEITNKGISELTLAVNESPVAHGFKVNTQAILDAIKNKRSLVKMEEAVAEVVETELESLDILEKAFEINCAEIDEITVEFPGLFPDKKNVALKSTAECSLTITARVEKHKNDLREKQEREAKAAADLKAKQEADAAKKATDVQVKEAAEDLLNYAKGLIPPEDKHVFSPPPSFPSPDDLPLPPKPYGKDYTITVVKYGTLAEAERLAADIEAYWPDTSVNLEGE